jgi:hypothetical protein
MDGRNMRGAYAEGAAGPLADKKVPGGAGFRRAPGRYPIDLFLPRETRRIRKWIEKYCLT